MSLGFPQGIHQPIHEPCESLWDMWGDVFVYTCKGANQGGVEVFLRFLTDEGAKEWAIVGINIYAITLKISGDGGEVYFTAHIAQTSRDNRYRLLAALEEHPDKMPKLYRQDLSAYVGRFFKLRQFQAVV